MAPPRSSAGVRPHPELHRSLAAGADLRVTDADRADLTEIFGRPEAAVLLDPERDHPDVRTARMAPGLDLGGAVAQPLVEEQGTTGIVGEQGGQGPVSALKDNLLGDRSLVNAQSG